MHLQTCMASFRCRAAAIARRLASLPSENTAKFCFNGLFWSFWATIALFPIGYGWREVMPPVCLLFLLFYYRHAWSRSVLARLKLFPLFCCLWAMFLIGVLSSAHPLDSLLHVGTGINKGFILPFIAMECVREERDLRRLVWACVFACFWQGLDGVWQAHSGQDLFFAYPLSFGRLTGSLGDYAVGNYIALALIPSFAIWFILREKYGRAESVFLFAALLWPACFLLLGAGARSSALAIAIALGMWRWLVSGGRPSGWRYLSICALSLCLLALFFVLSTRWKFLSAGIMLNDGRWDLWQFAWRIICDNPWFGVGAGQFNAAFRALDLEPTVDLISISHPHNLYLDLLYAHGLAGFMSGMAFLCGFLFWGYRHIRPNLLAELNDGAGSLYWRMAAAFWIAYAGWLANGIFAHDFYRTWWLALAMSYLGIMIGAVINGCHATHACAGRS